ncbi:Alpha/Beta hydrolase protein [Aspergillus keveii]|uniref:Dipeptidyl-peptidase V n=1 Tax=Aspergillus keveii TaxID=714993 RepID=A0ABR4G530_9EURO
MTKPTRPTPKLTPETLVSAPSRSHAIPSESGLLAVYTEETLSPTTPTADQRQHNRQRSIRVLETSSPRYWVVTSNPHASFPQWLGESDDLIWLEYVPETGQTKLVVGSAWLLGGASATYVAGVIEGPVRDFRVSRRGLDSLFGREEDDIGDLLFAVIGRADGDGGLWNPMAATRTGEMGSSENDNGGEEQRNVIWFGNLIRPSKEPGARYCMLGIRDLMSHFNLGALSVENVPDSDLEECRDFFLCSWIILFVAKDPEVDPATHTACSCYICPMMTWDGYPIPDDYYKASRQRGLGGKISSPYADPDGKIMFLSQKQDGYAADKNRIVTVPDMSSEGCNELFESDDGAGSWDLSPSAVWYASDKTLLIQVEEKGERVLYQLPHVPWPDTPAPKHLRRIDTHGSVLDVAPVPGADKTDPRSRSSKSRILASINDFVDSRIYHLIDLTANDASLVGPQHSHDQFGLSSSQVEQITFPGANGNDVHAWVIKPSFFAPDEKYPLAYFIHDGPHESWNRAWSIRCNLALFAEQGYIVVAPNIAGSTGYGQAFTDATRYSYAGAPYTDLERCIEYIEEHLEYIDMSRAVALGLGAYGGYLVNWLQGHDLGRRFRALVSDNGILNLMSHLSAPIHYPIFHELRGAPWDNPEEWKKWNPASPEYLRNWRTPQLIVHDERNRQVPVSEARAAYNTLRRRGIECSLLVFEDECDGEERKPKNVVLWYRTLLEWVARFTKGD